jgi:hypothetical protein
VTQQPAPLRATFTPGFAFALASGSQHNPANGQQQSPVTQQLSESATIASLGF